MKRAAACLSRKYCCLFCLAEFYFICFDLNSISGTMGAIVTCPLEVVKTRLQSSATMYRRNAHLHSLRHTSIFYKPEVHWNLYYHQHCPLNSRCITFPESVLPWTSAHPKGMLSCFRFLFYHTSISHMCIYIYSAHQGRRISTPAFLHKATW